MLFDGQRCVEVEAGVESLIQLLVILRETPPRILTRRPLDGELHHRRLEQSFDFGDRREERHTLSFGERLQHPFGHCVGSTIQHRALASPLGSECHSPDASIVSSAAYVNELLTLERAEESAQISRIESEPVAQLAYVGAVLSDFPE